MFYIIRFILISLLIVLPAVCVIYKLKKQKCKSNNTTNTQVKPIKIKKRYYAYSILILMVLFVLIAVCFYPFEKHFMTFASEKDAFDYICKNYSKCERFEQGDAIFYVERDKYNDTIYSITKVGNRYGYVNNQSEFAQYQEYNYKNTRFDVSVMYNETANVSFYDVVARNQSNPDNHNALLNDNNLAYASSFNKVWFNGEIKANCYYYMDNAEPMEEITVKASSAESTLKKQNVKHFLFVTYTDFSN